MEDPGAPARSRRWHAGPAAAPAHPGARFARAALLARALLVALLLCSPTAFAQIAFVQSTGLFNNPSAASITSTAFAANPTVGNTIIVTAWTYNSNNYPTISVADSAGNTYTQIVQPKTTSSGAGYQNTAIFYASVTATGANFKVTVKSAMSASQIDAVAAEYSGVGALDQSNGIAGTSTTATISVGPHNGPPVTELEVTSLGILLPSDVYTSISPSAGYTTLATQLDNLNNSGGGGAYILTRATGNQSVTWSSTGGTFSNWVAAMATFVPASGSGGTPGAFAAYETATAPASAYTGNINTKVSGQAYSIDVAALDAAKTAVNTSFSGSVLVQVIATTTSSPALDAYGCPATNPQTLTSSPGTVSISNGRSTIAFPAEPNAWPYAKVKVSYPAAGPTVVSCSGDAYAIRPATLSVVANDTACTAPCYLNNASTTGTPTHAAEAAFTLTATAYNGAATPAITTNYPASSSTLTPTALAVVAPATVLGGFVPGSMSGSAGSFVSSTATYSEVGAVSALLEDTVFAAVDASESATPASGITSPVTAASCSGYYVCSANTTFGRFIPAHFAVTPQAPVAACNGFTYFGEDFSTSFTLLAQNAGNGTTQNYAGSLAKLALTSWSNFVFSASGAPATSVLQSGATAPSGTWSAGSASVTATQNLSVPSTPAPPAAVTILAKPVDSDGVTLSSATAVTSTAATLYEGRALLSNAIGPETVDLNLPFLVEYWQSAAAGWQQNSADTCTHASISIANGTLSASATCVRDSGSPGNSGAGCAAATPIANHKYLEGGVSGTDSNGVAGFAGNFNLWLAGPGAGNLGYVTINATVPSWLQYDWTGTVGNPSAIATFGIPQSGKVLYRNEVYY